MALYLPANMTLVSNKLIRGKHSRLVYRSVCDGEKRFTIETSSLRYQPFFFITDQEAK